MSDDPDPIDTPLPRAARRLLLETMQRGEQAVVASQRAAEAAFQVAAQDVLADLGIPAGVASELVRDGQGRPVAIRWTRPAEKVVPAETVTSGAKDVAPAPSEAAS